MRAPMKATVLAASLLIAATANAQAPQSFRVISPVFGQLVSFAMPSNFSAVFENTKGGHYIREAVLKGETPERWTEMITVTGEKGMSLTPGSSPEKFAGSITGGFKSACPDSFAARSLGASTFGRFEGFVAVIGCGRVDRGPGRFAPARRSSAGAGAASLPRHLADLRPAPQFRDAVEFFRGVREHQGRPLHPRGRAEG